jgi:hypothetical protein
MPAGESRSTVQTGRRLAEGRSGREGRTHHSAAPRVASAIVSEGDGTPEHRLENGDGDEFAGFCVDLRAQRTRRRPCGADAGLAARFRIARAAADRVPQSADWGVLAREAWRNCASIRR